MQDSRVTVAVDFFQKFFGGNVGAACDLLDPQVVDVVPGTTHPQASFKARTLLRRIFRPFSGSQKTQSMS